MHYWNIQARNTVTGQTLKQQDLRGQHCKDHDTAMLLAQTFAEQLTARTRQTWAAQVVWCAATDL